MGLGQRIAKARQAKGWSQGELGDALNTGQTTVSSWERGRTEPSREVVQRIADVLDTELSQLELGDDEERSERATVPLVGYVGAGAEAHFWSSADEGLGEVDAPDSATPMTRAAEIRGTSLGPLFETWLIYYDDVRTPVTSDLIGRLCILGLSNGKVLVKQIRKSRAEGLYHLYSNTEEPMLDQEVEWAARVKDMRPR